MYISEIELNNLRCFSGKHKISLDRGDGTFAGWTVFAGRNGAGKTTLLKAIGAATAGPLVTRSLAGNAPDWIRAGHKTASIVVSVLRDNVLRSGDSFYESESGGPEALRLGLDWLRLGTRQNSEVVFSPAVSRSTRFHYDGPWHDKPLGWFIAGYGPYRRLGPPTIDVERASASPRLSCLINLFSEGATLGNAVDWLRELHARALERKPGAAELRDSVLDLLRDGLLPDGSSIKKIDSDGLWVGRGKTATPLKEVSDGYRSVTALVVDLVRRLSDSYLFNPLRHTRDGVVCGLPGVVLVDEIDAHMHVSWQQKIGLWLTKHFPRMQFLVTSHSPFICQAASPRGIVRLPAPGERRVMEHVSPALFRAVVNGGADDAVISELFGLEHSHSKRAEELRQEIAKLELKALTGSANSVELRKYESLKAELPDDIGELADRKLRAVRGGGKKKR